MKRRETIRSVALIFAGGSGTRMGKTIKPKQFLMLNGKAIIIRSILNFEQHNDIDAIAVVCLAEWQEYLRKLIDKEKIKKVKWIVPGGETGQQSIYNGLKIIYDNVENIANTIVLISDGVRPLVSKKIITENIKCVKKNGTSATSAFVPETIIEIDKNGRVSNIPDRSFCMASKAPQGYKLEQIMEAHHKAVAEKKFHFTNSLELMSNYGYEIHVVEDSRENIKVTTPEDLHICESILNERKKKKKK